MSSCIDSVWWHIPRIDQNGRMSLSPLAQKPICGAEARAQTRKPETDVLQMMSSQESRIAQLESIASIGVTEGTSFAKVKPCIALVKSEHQSAGSFDSDVVFGFVVVPVLDEDPR